MGRSRESGESSAPPATGPWVLFTAPLQSMVGSGRVGCPWVVRKTPPHVSLEEERPAKALGAACGGLVPWASGLY